MHLWWNNGAEDLLVDVWYDESWNNVFSDLNPGWNNISVTQYLDSSTFTIRVRDGTTFSDTLYDIWEIDTSLLHVWGETYTTEIELEGTSNLYEWTQLEWTTDASFTNSSIRVTVQLYNYSSGSYPETGNGHLNYTSGPADVDETENQIITDTPSDFRNTTSGWRLKILAEHTSQFDFNLDFSALNVTYYDEYKAQTVLTFTDITNSQSPHLNFTAVAHNSIDGANITLQLWNYTSDSYSTTGQGYASFTSTGVNNTRWLNITTNPSSCINGNYARILVTSTYDTTDAYQQAINFIRLLQDPIQKTHNYSLRVINLGDDTYNLRLISLSELGLPRLINCTILLNSSTQIQVLNGIITQDTGPWIDISGHGNQDIILLASSTTTDNFSRFELQLESREDATTVITSYPIYLKVD